MFGIHGFGGIFSLHLNEDGEKAPMGLREFQSAEDNSLEVFEVISNVLHFRNDRVYGNIDNALRSQIALLANKYSET